LQEVTIETGKRKPKSANAKKSLLREIYRNKYTYILLLPAIVFFAIFAYVPMYGIVLAFKDYMVGDSIMGSPWIGLANFKELFQDTAFWHAFLNTLRISFMNILIGFPVPIILAMAFNELKENGYRKFLQTIFTFPNFLSWVILGGIFINFFSSNGVINQLLSVIGLQRYEFLANSNLIRPILYVTNIWKGAGWGSIVYLAAISNISPEIYEAATMDGANRFQKLFHITWPGIKSTAVVLLILAVGGVMNGGFDQIFNLSNSVVQDATEIIDTYIYRITFGATMVNYGYSTAVGLFKGVINFTLLFTANKIANMLGERGIF
jgi:putative aldouronate transport system permease protein